MLSKFFTKKKVEFKFKIKTIICEDTQGDLYELDRNERNTLTEFVNFWGIKEPVKEVKVKKLNDTIECKSSRKGEYVEY